MGKSCVGTVQAWQLWYFKHWFSSFFILSSNFSSNQFPLNMVSSWNNFSWILVWWRFQTNWWRLLVLLSFWMISTFYNYTTPKRNRDTLPETNIAPWKWRVGIRSFFLLGWSTGSVWCHFCPFFLTWSKLMPTFFQVCLTPPARERKCHNLDVPHPGWRDALLVMVEDATRS